MRCQNRGFWGQEIDWDGSQPCRMKGRRPNDKFDEFSSRPRDLVWSVTFEPLDGLGCVRCQTRGFWGQENDWKGSQPCRMKGSRPKCVFYEFLPYIFHP